MRKPAAGERFLVARCRAGDERARNALIERHLPLVRHFVAKNPFSRPIDDYVHEAVMWLCRRLSLFDPDRGWKLSSWIGYEAKHAVVDRLRGSGSALVRVVRGPGRKGGRLPVASLDTPCLDSKGKEMGALREQLVDDADPFVEYDLQDEAATALSPLPARYREVLRRVYGLDGDGEWTMRAVAGDLGVSESRVRQIRRRAMRLLRA